MFCVNNRVIYLIDQLFGKKDRNINYKSVLVIAEVQKDISS